jgi:tetratricopeptide (TPR) repeat protein
VEVDAAEPFVGGAGCPSPDDSLRLVGGLLGHNAGLRREIIRADTAERKERDNYNKSRQTILGMFARFDDWNLGGRRNTDRMAEGMVQDALAYLQTVLDNGDNADPAVRADAASLLDRVGRIQAYHGRGEEARANIAKALRLYEQLSDEQPDVLSHRVRTIHCYRCLAALTKGDDDQPLAWYEKAVALGEELRRRDPDDFHHLLDLAQSHHDLASLLQLRQRLREAEAHYQQAIPLYEEVIAKHPEQSAGKFGLADSRGNLGLLYHETGRAGQAEKEFQRANALLEALMRDTPGSFNFLISRSAVALKWGNLVMEKGQIGLALSLFERGIEWSESVLRKEPNYASAREMAFKLHGSKANVYEHLHRYVEAVTQWDRVIELTDGDAQLEYRLRRALALARSGDPTRAAAEAERAAAEPNCSPDILYNAACVFALARRADKAITLLNRLQSRGYFATADNLNNLRTDKDLDPLRQRDDFKALLGEQTAKKGQSGGKK